VGYIATAAYDRLNEPVVWVLGSELDKAAETAFFHKLIGVHQNEGLRAVSLPGVSHEDVCPFDVSGVRRRQQNVPVLRMLPKPTDGAVPRIVVEVDALHR